MQGYLGNPKASAESINAGGWFGTGDIGYMKYGKVYIVDRKKVEFSMYKSQEHY